MKLKSVSIGFVMLKSVLSGGYVIFLAAPEREQSNRTRFFFTQSSLPCAAQMSGQTRAERVFLFV